jgi:tetratricopeptide (TPR) repeat protein
MMKLGLLTGAALLAWTAPVCAQEVLPPATPMADALAAQVRVLASSPRNLEALIAAADLSTRLGDPGAAMGFLARAQMVAPADPRIVATRAGALVSLERPGEALALYGHAERAGVSMTRYLAQRGLAYDLIGQPGYAQRDYRAALRNGSDDETTRRLALSLGISGQTDEAMAVLDPLLRRSDRAAWRARAFIMAMNGDVSGAQTIATRMLPNGSAFAPYFARMRSLSPSERAFAVHFGDPTPTPARIADARMAPTLAPLSGATPTVVAAVASPPASTPVAQDRTAARRAGASASSQQSAAATRAEPGRQPITQSAAITAPLRQPAAPSASTVTPPLTRSPAPGWAVTADTAMSLPVPSPTPSTQAQAFLPAASRASTASPGVVSSPTPLLPGIGASTSSSAVTTTTPAPAAVVAAAPRPIAPAPAVPTAAQRRANTEALAAIISRISVPASELEPVKAASRESGREAARKPGGATQTLASNERGSTRSRGTAEAASSSRAATRGAATADAKPAAKKPEPKAKPAAKPEAARWWVQVAGGARAADLDKDWKRLSEKGSALKGRQAYVTPLRATHRLLTGPFKSEAEARAVVNALAKEGKSAFTFQSAAGQKVEKLGD